MIVAKESSGQSFEPITQGVHMATCIMVIDLGEQYSQQYDKTQRKIMLTFEVHDETVEINGEDKPRNISKEYTLSLGEKSNLRKDLESWRGKKFTETELQGFSLDKVLGVSCQLNILHTDRGNNVYANVASIIPLPKGMAMFPVVGEKVVFDLDAPEIEETMKKLPEWIQKKIKDSETYKEMEFQRG